MAHTPHVSERQVREASSCPHGATPASHSLDSGARLPLWSLTHFLRENLPHQQSGPLPEPPGGERKAPAAELWFPSHLQGSTRQYQVALFSCGLHPGLETRSFLLRLGWEPRSMPYSGNAINSRKHGFSGPSKQKFPTVNTTERPAGENEGRPFLGKSGGEEPVENPSIPSFSWHLLSRIRLVLSKAGCARQSSGSKKGIFTSLYTYFT